MASVALIAEAFLVASVRDKATPEYLQRVIKKEHLA
jgi:hypothetical protein